MNKDIYKMKLHEIIIIYQIEILRVPDGWIYSYHSEQVGGHMQVSSTFVPYIEEFK